MVEGATPSVMAACLIVMSSPSGVSAARSQHGISQWRRRLPTRPAVKRWPEGVGAPWRFGVAAQIADTAGGEAMAAGCGAALPIEDAGDDAVRIMDCEAAYQRDGVLSGAYSGRP